MFFKPFILMKLFLLIISFLSISLLIKAQTMSLSDAEGVNCTMVSVDLDAVGFPEDVAAVTLIIDYDSLALTYDSYTPGTFSSFVFINEVSGRLTIQWLSVLGQAIDGLCLTLHFNYAGGAAILDFDEDNCDIADFNNDPILTTYVNGSVSNYANDTIYVDGAVVSSGDGQSWAGAYKTIGEAAVEDLKGGDIVLVKPGTYAENIQVNWSGVVDVPPSAGVEISDTNKITFPSGTDLSCIDISTFPGMFYAYVFRSWKGNNGYFEITEVDDVNDYVRVSSASFYPESGTVGDSSRLMAAVCQPVVMKNSSLTPDVDRVILNAGTLGSIDEVMLIGGDAASDIASAVIIDGFDITGASSGTGLHIKNSEMVVYANGKIYNSNGPGIEIDGTPSLPSKFNVVIGNDIYNTPDQAIVVGSDGTSQNNNDRFTHIINNEIYNLGSSSLADFENAVLIKNGNSHAVIEGNVIRDIRMNTVSRGMVSIDSHSDSVLVYANILRNLNGLNTGEHYFNQIGDSISGIKIFNNIIYNESSSPDQDHAFRINGSLHTGSEVCFNTVYQVHKGLILEDYGSALDFSIRNNIFDLNSSTYFTNLGTSGRYTVNNNIYPTISTSYGLGNIVDDPGFIAPASNTINGLRPRYDSPCLGAGISISGIVLDYLGGGRDGSSPSIGAFEGPLLNTVWTGENGEDWDDSRNWDVEIVPNQYLNAVIPSGSNQPTISGGDASCRTLEVSAGMEVTITEGSVLTVGD